MLAVFVAVGLAVFLFTRLDDEIRRQVQQKLSEQFPQFNISVGGARLVEGQGIAIYDLAVSETSSTRLQNNLLVVDEIMFSCNAQLTKLVQGLPDVQRVVVRHPQIWAAKNRDGGWNLSSLWPLPSCGNRKPQVIVENAHFTFSDLGHPELPAVTLRDVNLTIDPPSSQKESSPKIVLTGTQPQAQDCATFKLRGSFGGPYVERADFEVSFDTENMFFQLQSQFEKLVLSKGVFAWAEYFGGRMTREATLLGKVDGQLSVSHQIGSNTPPKMSATLQVQEARLEHPRLPRPLVDLSCQIRCENDRLAIENLLGTCGSATVAMRLQRQGWTSNAPMALSAKVENVTLDEKLYLALPEILQQEWDKYRPQGVVDAQVQATFDGQQWQPVAKLVGRDLSFESNKFPYRVHDGFGRLEFTPRREATPAQLDIDLTGYGGGQPLRFVGQVFDPRPGAIGWIEVTGSNLEIEDRMIAALPDKTREVIESMHPKGKFNLRWRLDRTQLGQEKPHTSMQLELLDCRMNYEKFPYPLSGIHGMVLAEDQRWQFRDLKSSGSRAVRCQGYLRPLDTGLGNQLYLVLYGEQLPLDDDLRYALPPAVQQAWLELRPRGKVDMQAEVTHLTGLPKPTINVAVNPRPDSTTIQPTFFPYLMEQLEGTFHYQNNQLMMSEVRAKHGRTEMRTNGNGEFHEDGSWNIQFEGLSVDRLMARRDLTDALPTKLQKLVEYLKPSGSFNLSNGMLSFSRGRGTNATVNSEWDLQLNCMQANIQTGVELSNIYGAVRLKGASSGNKSYSAGELALDTVTFQDVQFTEIQGPMWVDQGRCLFGSWATSQQGLPLRRLQAKVYGGTVIADAGVSFDVVPEYRAIAMLTGANLQRLMKERVNGQLDYAGNLAATLTLTGKGRTLTTLNGFGEVQITEANIYELPLLVNMLKVLRNETPTKTAFNQCLSKFRIQGPNIYLDQLEFRGNAVTLVGSGETNFDQQLNLDFHAVVGRNEIRMPLVKNFVNRMGEQTLQMTVGGTWSNPVVDTQALPGINQLIQQIQGESDVTAPPSPTPRNAERTFPSFPSWGRQ